VFKKRKPKISLTNFLLMFLKPLIGMQKKS
ncbi:hypothetical protein A5834_001771, partial [Enterococcus faecium]